MQTPVKIPHIILAQEAANENTPHTRLQELAFGSIELTRVVAANARANGELLRELSSFEDAETRIAVASNPNTPTDILFKLGIEFPQQLLDNSVFSLLLLENPNLVQDIPEDTLASLLRLPTVPNAFIEWALTRKQYASGTREARSQIMFALAMNPKLSQEALQTLIYEAGKHWTTARVPNVAKLHVNWASEMTTGWKEAAFSVVQKRNIAKDNIEHDQASEPSLWEIGIIPEEFLTALHPNSLREIARQEETPGHILEMLLQSKMATKKVRVAVASNLNTPVHILEKLAGEEDPEVRRAAFLNPNTPTAIFQLFHKYQNAITLVTPQRTIANPQADAQTLCKIAKCQWTHICKEVASHPNTPTSLLIDFAHHKYWRIRASAANNPNLPIDLLEQLARDKRLGVRQGVVLNPNTPTTVLMRLLKDKSWDLRRNIAQHPNVTPAILVSLAKDNYASVRVAVIENPKTPIQLLAQLATDTDTYVRKSVAQNSRISAAVLMQLGEDSRTVVRQAVASNPNTSPLVLTKLAGDEDSTVRIAIAQNLNTPDDVLAYLQADKYDWIKQTAWKTRQNRNSSISPSSNTSTLHQQPSNQIDIDKLPETPIETLLKLLETKDSDIRRAVFANLYQKIASATDIYNVADLLAEISTLADNLDLKIALARHPHTDTSTLQKFASSPSFRLRRLVAQNPNLCANLLEKLLEDKNSEVRRAALRGLLNQVQANSNREFNTTLNEFLQQWQATQNPNTPDNILINIAHSKWVIIREAVALHPQAAMIILNPTNINDYTSIKHNKNNLTLTLLEKLANDRNLVVKIAVTKNPHVPQNILEHLTTNHHCHSLVHKAAVKTLLQQYPQRAGLFSERYLSNNSVASISRFFILLHPLTPCEFLSKYFCSSSWLERYALASNPNTPQHIREHLTHDANRIVRAAAKAQI
jgi:hypothetical protein